MNVTLAALGRSALDLLYPPRCVLCSRGGAFLCTSCRDSLPRAAGARCDACWLPVTTSVCRACSMRSLALTRLRSVFRYEGEVRRLVHAFKFHGHSALAPELSALLYGCYREQALEADVVVPVPLAGLRKRLRGFNQASLLACGLAKAAELPCVEALRRAGGVSSQARSSDAGERRRNVLGAFSVTRKAAIADRRVLLVDDVATTGETLSACARVLQAAGARSVSALTLARED